MPETQKLLTIIVPVFNEEAVLEYCHKRLSDVSTKFMDAGISCDLLFVNDGSKDKSLDILRSLAAENKNTKVVSFTRNFGHQIAVSAGIDECEADYVAIIDADLQDPPELLLDMFDNLITGFDVVYGQRRKRSGESVFKKLTAFLFYRFLSAIIEVKIPVDTGDFRIMTRRTAELIAGMRERRRFLRGLIPWTGFRAKAFLYDREPRFAGETKYPLSKMVSFAISAITSFSTKPLAFAAQLGLLAIALGLVLLCYILFLLFTSNLVVPGLTITLLAIVMFSGVQLVILGIIGNYIGQILDEVKARPLYVVDEKINL
jgi:dolichol-phosphate mannosyltransferase